MKKKKPNRLSPGELAVLLTELQETYRSFTTYLSMDVQPMHDLSNIINNFEDALYKEWLDGSE